jgi:hypothetical protein
LTRRSYSGRNMNMRAEALSSREGSECTGESLVISRGVHVHVVNVV